MKPTIFHDDANAGFDAAIAYYEEQDKGLGLRFHLEVQRAVEIIERHRKSDHRINQQAFGST